MPVEREEWSRRIKAVERQFLAVRFGIDHLLAQIQKDPSIAVRSPVVDHLKDASRDLEITYLIRMFAEFEYGLRSFWSSEKPNKKPKAEHLLNGIASNCSIPNEVLQNLHAVRIYRNRIVHGDEHRETIIPIPLPEVRKRLS